MTAVPAQVAAAVPAQSPHQHQLPSEKGVLSGVGTIPASTSSSNNMATEGQRPPTSSLVQPADVPPLGTPLQICEIDFEENAVLCNRENLLIVEENLLRFVCVRKFLCVLLAV